VTPADLPTLLANLRREAAALRADADARAGRVEALAAAVEEALQGPRERDLLKLTEVAQRLNVSRPTASELCLRGELPFVRIGRRGVRVPAKAVEEYRRRRTHAPPSMRAVS